MKKGIEKLLKKIKKYSVDGQISILMQYIEEYPEDYNLVMEYIDSLKDKFKEYAEKSRKIIDKTNELLKNNEFNSDL